MTVRDAIAKVRAELGPPDAWWPERLFTHPVSAFRLLQWSGDHRLDTWADVDALLSRVEREHGEETL